MLTKSTENVSSLLLRTRSIRRFQDKGSLTPETLESLVELTRYCPSGANRQPLKYMCISKKEDCRFVTKHVKWAALLPEWEGPAEEEEPSAYILVMIDKKLSENAPYDSGIASHAILMGATEKGLGGCMLGNIDRESLHEYFGINRIRYRIDLAIALGVPAEEPVIEEAVETTTYYRDENDILHVPKRKLSELLCGGTHESLS